MFYEFPVGMTLDEVTDVCARFNEELGTRNFIRIDRGDHVIFDYVNAYPEAFPSMTGDPVRDRELAILRECRGLTFSTETGLVLARKFHKFFNCGQREEVLMENIDWSAPHCVLDKMDGSMITPYPMPDGSVGWNTKLGFTDVAEKVKPFIAENPNYVEAARHCMDAGLTPMLEFCSLRQRIVIMYPKERLVLLAIRDNHTGHYLSYEEMTQIAERFGLDIVEVQGGAIKDIAAFVQNTMDQTGIEGFIVRFDNGHMVKMKTMEYCQIHRAVSNITSEKFILNLIVDNILDDALPLLPPEDQESVLAFEREFHQGVAKTAAWCREVAIAEYEKVDRDDKRFALEIVPTYEGVYRQFLFKAARDADIEAAIRHCVKLHLGSSTRIDIVRTLWGGAKWDWADVVKDRIAE